MFNDDGEDAVSVEELSDQAPVNEAPEEYGHVDDDDPPGVSAPPDLENQNEGEVDDA